MLAYTRRFVHVYPGTINVETGFWTVKHAELVCPVATDRLFNIAYQTLAEGNTYSWTLGLNQSSWKVVLGWELDVSYLNFLTGEDSDAWQVVEYKSKCLELSTRKEKIYRAIRVPNSDYHLPTSGKCHRQSRGCMGRMYHPASRERRDPSSTLVSLDEDLYICMEQERIPNFWVLLCR